MRCSRSKNREIVRARTDIRNEILYAGSYLTSFCTLFVGLIKEKKLFQPVLRETKSGVYFTDRFLIYFQRYFAGPIAFRIHISDMRARHAATIISVMCFPKGKTTTFLSLNDSILNQNRETARLWYSGFWIFTNNATNRIKHTHIHTHFFVV